MGCPGEGPLGRRNCNLLPGPVKRHRRACRLRHSPGCGGMRQRTTATLERALPTGRPIPHPRPTPRWAGESPGPNNPPAGGSGRLAPGASWPATRVRADCNIRVWWRALTRPPRGAPSPPLRAPAISSLTRGHSPCLPTSRNPASWPAGSATSRCGSGCMRRTPRSYRSTSCCRTASTRAPRWSCWPVSVSPAGCSSTCRPPIYILTVAKAG